MLRTTGRILMILLICGTTGLGIFQIVDHQIDTASANSFEGWSEFFRWLRHLSSMGWLGVVAHALPFAVAIAIVVVIERLLSGSKK